MAAAGNLLTRITAENKSQPELDELAYTLQVGRDAMEQRLGILTSSIDELAEKLREFLGGEDVIDDLFSVMSDRIKRCWPWLRQMKTWRPRLIFGSRSISTPSSWSYGSGDAG